MQHVVNIAFDFDDDRVKMIAEKAIAQDMDSIIKGIILDRIAPEKYSYYGGKKDRNWDSFNSKVNERIDAIMNEHKQEIIDLAASKLVDSFKRTKVWKEKAGKVLDSNEEAKHL